MSITSDIFIYFYEVKVIIKVSFHYCVFPKATRRSFITISDFVHWVTVFTVLVQLRLQKVNGELHGLNEVGTMEKDYGKQFINLNSLSPRVCIIAIYLPTYLHRMKLSWNLKTRGYIFNYYRIYFTFICSCR